MAVNSKAKTSDAAWQKAGASSIFVLVLTSIHHVYGAIIYKTPWRMHVVYLTIPAAILIASFFSLAWRHRRKPFGRTAAWLGVALVLVFPVGLIGIYEGGYNHVVKNVLYFGGATDLVSHLFPPPDYELPNNVFFELTGIAQLFAALMAGRRLLHLSRLPRTSWVAAENPIEQHDAGRPHSGFQNLDVSGSQGACGSDKNRMSQLSEAKKVRPGKIITRRELMTIRDERVSVPDARQLVHLQFRRFAGCPVCNLHLQSVVRRHDEIVAAGICEIVVFHSTRDELLAQEADLPFAVIADPDKKLYAEFGVESSVRALLDPRAWISILRAVFNAIPAVARGQRPAPSVNPRGGRFGLPADFLIGMDGRVLSCKYGAHADDQWSVDEVLDLVPTQRDCELQSPERMAGGLIGDDQIEPVASIRR